LFVIRCISTCRALIVGRTVGDRAFAAAGPTLWNSLPHDITDCVTDVILPETENFFYFLYHFHDFIFLFSGP